MDIAEEILKLATAAINLLKTILEVKAKPVSKTQGAHEKKSSKR